MLRWACGRARLDRVRKKDDKAIMQTAPVQLKMREQRLQWVIIVLRSSDPVDHLVIYDEKAIRVQLPPFVLTSDQGSSATPTVTFTILDPCRDYKFRVIIVLRSSDPVDHLVIYDEKAIRVQLPPFVLTSDQVFAEHPTFNETTDSLKIYVRWTLPRGYSDSDIYGYEAPALYPIQCRTPEDELPQPKIEIVRAGGRLAVTLPLSVLEARCRLWVEVRMLPRCVRLEPFSIQKNIEIDCNRNFDMDICRKEAGPMCMEIQAVSGKRGRATITWLPPPRIPLYYHVRYGPAQIKVDSPHTIWQISTKRDIKADGTVTNLALDVVEDQVYGVQTSTTEEMSATTTSSLEATSEETATEIDEVSTTEDSKVIDVEADLVHPETEQPRATSIVSVDLEEDKQLTASEESEYIAESESNNKRKQISRELEESVRHLEKALDDADLRRKISTDDSTLELSMANRTSSEDDAIFKAASELKNKLESSSAEVRSDEAGDHIRSVFGADRLLVEFGRVVEEKELPNGSCGGPLFNDNRRTRMVAAIEKLVRSGAFVEEPFVFHVNESVNVADESYGIRFCTFNSTRIKAPYLFNNVFASFLLFLLLNQKTTYDR
ncbi:hypothetical protein TELCIR_05865 [Teladorsagia circumcincta]|uniref:Fibronectin type-III domain-containing protein n=1 Tax=Teladorsagia circumcincta TaxID=45464 RepID=A0A2G9UPX0_TELCI|nr:hypothetical protein TELCIR_05865 [Teladorsagia circumcincta]